MAERVRDARQQLIEIEGFAQCGAVELAERPSQGLQELCVGEERQRGDSLCGAPSVQLVEQEHDRCRVQPVEF
jgi:hypothetical protein